MCGICGEFHFDARERVDSARVRAMTDRLAHRGPDDEGFYFSEPQSLGLGHRRLKVIDLEGGLQPMFNEDGSIVLIYNGEIYNFIELREELKARGHRFRSQSDTEVIVHQYEEDGPECVNKFNGMFAFALWDHNKQRLMLARDRLGIKPLYWTRQGNRLIFGSELNSLIYGLGEVPEKDQSGMWSYLAIQYVPAPRTIFQGVEKLEPGTLMLVDSTGTKVSRYWSLPEQGERGEKISGKDAQAGLRDLLEDSVKKRLVADVPLGAFLSGGIDSSSIVAMMRRHKGGGLKTFSVDFEAKAGAEDLNETYYSRLAARHYGTEHYPLTVGAAEVLESLPEVTSHLGEPVADPACIPTYLVSKLAREQVTVVLTGEGADEIFAGYLRYRLGSLAFWYRMFPGLLRQTLLSHPLPRRVRKGMIALGETTPALRHLAWVSVFQRDQLERLLGGKGDARRWARGVFEGLFAGQREVYSLERTLRADIVTWLPDDLLTKVDGMSMAVSLEARVPFLDHRLVELALRIPPHEKMRAWRRKLVLKKAVRGLLPEEIIRRKKAGFTLPLDAWFRSELKELLMDTLSTERMRREGIFDPMMVEGLIADHLSGRQNNGQALYSLLLFEIWQDKIKESVSFSTRS